MIHINKIRRFILQIFPRKDKNSQKVCVLRSVKGKVSWKKKIERLFSTWRMKTKRKKNLGNLRDKLWGTWIGLSCQTKGQRRQWEKENFYQGKRERHYFPWWRLTTSRAVCLRLQLGSLPLVVARLSFSSSHHSHLYLDEAQVRRSF